MVRRRCAMASTSESALTDTSDISADGVPSLDVEVVGVGNAQPVSLLTLHEDAVQEILTRLSYDEIARMRLVRYFCYSNPVNDYLMFVVINLFTTVNKNIKIACTDVG